MSDPSVRETLRTFILTNFLPGEEPSSLGDSTPLVTGGVVTSLSLLELVTFIEDKYSVELDVDDLGVSRMDSIDLLTELVAERIAAR